MIIDILLIVIIVLMVSVCTFTIYIAIHNDIIGQKQINIAIDKLNNCGILYNHSLKIIKKHTNRIQYIRVYNIKYNNDTKKTTCYCFMTTKDGEIGTWCDDINYILDIPNNWEIEDLGEWDPNK